MPNTSKDDVIDALLEATEKLAQSALKQGSSAYALGYAQAAREIAEAYKLICETS